MYTLKLLGGASLSGADGPLTGPVVQRHRLALLALLGTRRQEGLSRDKLAAYLWPESDTERARNSLKQAVHAIRRALGHEAVLSAGDGLRLNPQVVSCDAVEFEEAADRGDATAAVARYAGAFLDGFFLSGSAEFEQWADLRRAHLQDRYTTALETLAAQCESAGDASAAARWWRRLAAVVPGNSRVALRLMAALAAAGDRTAAIQHAKVHVTLLREEFGAEPDPDVLALLERLRNEPAGAGLPAVRAAAVRAPVSVEQDKAMIAPRPKGRRRWLAVPVLVAATIAGILGAKSRAAPSERSLAVLPFADLSGAESDAYFSDGMTEELIHTLSQVRGLRVTARTSAFQFRGRTVDVRDVGRDLDVALVVEGSVRRSGDQVRITAQLVSTGDGSHLWSETYDRSLDDVLAVQEDIARAISSAMRLRLASSDSRLTRHSDDHEAYLLYLKGRHVVRQRTPAAVHQAVTYFEQATRRDPRYALAYAGVAYAHMALVDVAGVLPGVAMPLARAAALHALELDSRLADAHTVLGWMYTQDWQWDAAQRAFARALEINPDEPETYIRYSLYLDNMGRFDEALGATLRAQALDPLSPNASYNVAGSYLHLARFEPAIAEAQRIIELHPTNPLGYDVLGWALVDAGRPAEAVDVLEKAVSIGEGRWLALANLGRAYAFTDRRADARAIIERLERDWGGLGFGNFALAAVHLALGERDLALARLEQVYRLRSAKLPHVRQWTAFEPLYGDPDFSRIVREAGFVPPGPVVVAR